MRSSGLIPVIGCLVLAACSTRAGAGVEVQPGVVGGGVIVDDGDAPGDKVWVCHQGSWQEVGAPAGDAHARHGDVVSERPRTVGASC